MPFLLSFGESLITRTVLSDAMAEGCRGLAPMGGYQRGRIARQAARSFSAASTQIYSAFCACTSKITTC